MPTAPSFLPRCRQTANGLVSATGIAVAVALAGYIAHAATVRYPLRTLPFVADPGTWRGAYHMHTRFSDGLGSVEEVAQAAARSGAAWVLITDHDRASLTPPRYMDGVLMVFSTEVSTPAGHVTAPGIIRTLTAAERRGDALDSIRRLGGSPVAAHPLHRRRPFTQLDDSRLAGLEVVSLDDLFQETLHSPLALALTAAAYPVNPEYAAAELLTQPIRTLGVWDRLLAARPTMGLCALDAHGRPSYEAVMRVMGTYAIVGAPRTGDAATDGERLVSARTSGRSYCGIDAQAAAGGFRFTARTEQGTIMTGGSVGLDRGPVLQIDLAYEPAPSDARPRLVCNGAPKSLVAVPAASGLHFEFTPDRPGWCRAEVRLGGDTSSGTPWILANPIYIR
jgi:hypothetical protein